MNTEKIILVYYLNLGNITPERASEILESFGANLYRKIKEAHHILLPIRNGNTRVECLNPKIITQEEYRSVKVFLERAEGALSDILKETQRPIKETQKPTLETQKPTLETQKPTFFQKLIGSFKNRKS
jgi:hypothetical protein